MAYKRPVNKSNGISDKAKSCTKVYQNGNEKQCRTGMLKLHGSIHLLRKHMQWGRVFRPVLIFSTMG